MSRPESGRRSRVVGEDGRPGGGRGRAVLRSPSVSDLVTQVADQVRARTPLDAREAASIERVLHELATRADPFSATADPTHVTGSAIVVGRRGIVLLRHRRLGIWVQPGGHVDPGETPWAAAAREACEETGLAVELAEPGPELVHVDVHDGGRGHTHLDLRYLCRAGDDDPAPPPDESQDVHWFAWPTALTRAEPTMTGLLATLAQRCSEASSER